MFQAMIERVGSIVMIYADPTDHARDNCRAEKSNQLVEGGIRSILFDRNLGPTWWQKAATDVQELAALFPPISSSGTVSVDGDRASPIELLLHGYVSRNEVFRRLDSYVQVGTPALCHLKDVEGSDLECGSCHIFLSCSS